MKKHIDWKRVGWVIGYILLVFIASQFFQGYIWGAIDIVVFIAALFIADMILKLKHAKPEVRLSHFFYHNGEDKKE